MSKSIDCLFCKIIQQEIPAKIFHEDEEIFAFYDINPQAPTHLLIIPKKHIPTLNDLDAEDNAMLGHLIQSAAKFAKTLGHDEQGYRLVTNCNDDGGQTVHHIHWHLLAGRRLTWPPG